MEAPFPQCPKCRGRLLLEADAHAFGPATEWVCLQCGYRAAAHGPTVASTRTKLAHDRPSERRLRRERRDVTLVAFHLRKLAQRS
ncbi:MAG TPA: hypothetical protein VKQ30_08255 [Ktedonobacterales bacterium]|nr:hypothetical protein [Ktedonobacterales bacterium]